MAASNLSLQGMIRKQAHELGRHVDNNQQGCLSTKVPKEDLTCFPLDPLWPKFAQDDQTLFSWCGLPAYYDVLLASRSVSICRLTSPMKHYWGDCLAGISN